MRSRKIQKAMMVFFLMFLMVVFVKADVMAAASVSSNKATVSIIVGKKKQIRLKGAKGKVVWKTSKKTIATVSQKGVITAKKKGVAIITATTKSQKWSYKVTVKESPAINMKSATLKVGKMCTLKVTGASSRPVLKNLNTSVVTLKKQSTYVYKLLGKKKGTSIINVRVAGKTLKCKVTVKNTGNVQPADSKINPHFLSDTVTLNQGECNEICVDGFLTESTDSVKWTSSNPNILGIISSSNTSVYVGAFKDGTVTITASQNGVSAKCTVTVKPFASIEINRKSIKLIQDKETTCGVQTEPWSDFVYQLDPRFVEISNSNPEIASAEIDKESKQIVIKGLKDGTTTLSVTAGNISSECKITVIGKPDVIVNVSGKTKYWKMDEGDIEQIPGAEITLNIKNNDNRRIFISSSPWSSRFPGVYAERMVNELTGTRIEKDSDYADLDSINGDSNIRSYEFKEDEKYYYELSNGNNEIISSAYIIGSRAHSYEEIKAIDFYIATYDGTNFETWPYYIKLN